MNNQHFGSDFDEFLEEENLLVEVEIIAIKRVIACQIVQLMQESGLSKTAMAQKMNTSRSSLDRLLDPNNPSVNLQTIAKAATTLGKKLQLSLV